MQPAGRRYLKISEDIHDIGRRGHDGIGPIELFQLRFELYFRGVELAIESETSRASPVSGARIEAVVDATPVGSTTANAAGEATVAIPRAVGKNDAEANVFVDLGADNLRRVLIVERGKAPAAPGEGCDRKDIQGLYWIRNVSTIVVTLSDPTPRVLLRQGSFSFKPPRVFEPPTGLIVFGGGGLSKIPDIALFACGDVNPCSDTSSGWTGTPSAQSTRLDYI